MYVYVQEIPNWISYSYGGLFRLGYYILNLRIFESSRIISRWGCASNSTYLPDSATHGRTLSTLSHFNSGRVLQLPSAA